MSFSDNDYSDGEEDHAMDNIRAMLQDYYGTDNGGEVKEEDYYDMDSKVFDKDKYIPKILREQSLPELIKTNIRVVSEAKQLDSDMQKLVYENYSRFMSASKTVRTLQDNVGDMETRMSSLLEKIQVVSTLTGTVGSSLDSNRTKVDKLVSVKRLLKKLQFLFDLPARLQRCVELEAYDQAVDYYTSSKMVLNDYRHIKSFNAIQESADAIMSKLKTTMVLAIQEPTILMTRLEDFVRLLMKLGHPVEDLYTIYLNYHSSRLNEIIEKYQKLKPLSEDEKEIIALSGSEEEVEKVRSKQKVTNEYPLLQFMSMLEKEFVDLLIHVAVAYTDIFKGSESSQTSLIAFTQDLMTKYMVAVTDRISSDTSYEHVIETETISPFGEIRSALDIMHQDVVKVDNIVKNTGLLPSMETLIKNTVKTQMAGSFDVIRGELANVIKTADTDTQALPLWEAPKPKPVPEPIPVPAATTTAAASTAEPSAEAPVAPSTDDLFATTMAPVPGEGPVTLPESSEKTSEVAPVAPAPVSTPEPVEKEAPRETVESIGKYVSEQMETLLRRVVERLHSLLSLVQVTVPDALVAFTDYFYTQIQQTLLWFSGLLFRIQNTPHSLLYGTDDAVLYADSDSKKPALYLNEALVQQLPQLSVSSRTALGLFNACRLISRSVIKSIVQTLVDYTPEDPSIDQEALTRGMNISSLVQISNDAAASMLRCFAILCADELSADFIEHVLNASDLDSAIADSTFHAERLLFTAFQDCDDAVVDTVVEMGVPTLETLTKVTRENGVVDESEVFNYIERAMASRVYVLPQELRPTIMDVVGSTMKLFVKNVLEEIRSNMIFEYQFHNVVVNLAFVLSMAKALLPDTADLRGFVEETVKTAYERCFGPTIVDEEAQKKVVSAAIDSFMKGESVSSVCCYCRVNHHSPSMSLL